MIDSFIKSTRMLINRMYSSRTESLVRKGVVSPLRRVPSTIKRPPYVGINDTSLPVSDQMSTIYRLTPAEVNVMRAAGKIARQTMDHISKHVKAGITTDSLDVIAHTYILSKNAYPSPLLYSGFPKSICTSVNEVLCHGIPDSRILREGDILNVDITVYYHGYHADMSNMFLIGDVDDESKDLVEMTRKCLEKAIQVCGPGVPFNTIGEVTETLANENGYNIQPDFTGHGIGKHFHSGPHVYHSQNLNMEKMLPGMAFTIEPILVAGDPDFDLWDDGWTAVTVDKSRSAQVEHTILVTDSGVEILTA